MFFFHRCFNCFVSLSTTLLYVFFFLYSPFRLFAFNVFAECNWIIGIVYNFLYTFCQLFTLFQCFFIINNTIHLVLWCDFSFLFFLLLQMHYNICFCIDLLFIHTELLNFVYCFDFSLVALCCCCRLEFAKYFVFFFSFFLVLVAKLLLFFFHSH